MDKILVLYMQYVRITVRIAVQYVRITLVKEYHDMVQDSPVLFQP